MARRDCGAAVAEASAIKPDAVIADLHEFEATTTLRELAAADPQCPVILMARSTNVDAAIEALKAGALDYLAKPFDRERLRDVLVTVRKRVERRETLLRIDADLAKQFEFCGMIGRGRRCRACSSHSPARTTCANRAHLRRNRNREGAGRESAA